MTERVVLAYSGGLDTFDQSLSKGFIEIGSLPNTISARRDAGAL